MRDVSIQRIREIAERVAASEGLEVVDVELRGRPPSALLRIFIDKPDGVTHRDCEVVSTQVGAILDVEDPIPGRYTLEVSSPGVERRLNRPADYTRFAGQKVKLVVKEPVDGHRQLLGRLEGLEGGTLTLLHDSGERVQVAYDNIERANLVFEWPEPARHAARKQ
jgi:ribosome maturation factor RimP